MFGPTRAGCTWRPSSTPAPARVVGWALADHLRTELALDALTMALADAVLLPRPDPPFRPRHPVPGPGPTLAGWPSTASSRASAGRGRAGTMPSLRASSPLSRPSCSIARPGRPDSRPGRPSSSTSRSSTIVIVDIPPSAISLQPSSKRATISRRSPPDQTLHRNGSSPCPTAALCAGSISSSVCTPH